MPSLLILTGAYAEAQEAALESWRITSATQGPEHDSAAAIARTTINLYPGWHETTPDTEYLESASQWQNHLPEAAGQIDIH